MLDALLERLALALAGRGIPYMVIGGQAVLLYGEPRVTKDIDITLGVDVDRIDDILAVATAAGIRPLVEASDFTRRTMVLPCADDASGLRVDFIFSFTPYESEAIARGRDLQVGTASVRFIGPEDLIIHKILAGRPRDLEDVRTILVKNPNLDLSIVRRVLADFQQAAGESLLDRLEAILGDL